MAPATRHAPAASSGTRLAPPPARAGRTEEPHDPAIGSRTFSGWSLRARALSDPCAIPVRVGGARRHCDALSALPRECAPARTVPAIRRPEGTGAARIATCNLPVTALTAAHVALRRPSRIPAPGRARALTDRPDPPFCASDLPRRPWPGPSL
jgi:hypothetical protein